MGKCKASNLRISYPDAAVVVPSASIQIHRTNKGRLSRRLNLYEAAQEPAVNEDADANNEADNEPLVEPPWTDGFFIDNSHISSSESDFVVQVTAPLAARSFLEDFVRYRQSILNELILQDGRLGGRACYTCVVEDGLYRCKDCLHRNLSCSDCIVQAHSELPLHRLEVSFPSFARSTPY